MEQRCSSMYWILTRHCDNALSVRFASLANNDGIIKSIDEANKAGVRIDILREGDWNQNRLQE